MYIYMYIHICICMFIYVYVYTYVFRYICVYIYVYIYIYVCIYTYIYICIYKYVSLFTGIALASDGPLGLLITCLILPTLSGTTLAILFPDTAGLDQYLEMDSYWFQHYLIILMPIYLLQRRNGLAIDMCSIFTVSLGICILTFAHFTLYEVRLQQSFI
jgi:hypothetical protein